MSSHFFVYCHWRLAGIFTFTPLNWILRKKLWRCFTHPLSLVACICRHLPTCLFVVFLNYKRVVTIKQKEMIY
jgi:hypothetical protein